VYVMYVSGWGIAAQPFCRFSTPLEVLTPI
jgi:hypothetical protein